MKLDGNKGIVLLGLILLIVAGVIVVSLKGFNVALEYGKHERIDLKVGNNVNLKDVESICKEVLGDKAFKVRNLEVFGDSVSILSENFTDDEETNILSKINEKYGTKFVVEKEDKVEENAEESVEESAEEVGTESTPTEEVATETTPAEESSTEATDEVSEENEEKEVSVKSIPKLRIRDMVSPYIKGTVIAGVIIVLYLIIMLKVSSKNIFRGVLEFICDICLVELTLAALIAICRVPMSPVIINVLFVAALLTTIKFIKNIDKLDDGEAEKE